VIFRWEVLFNDLDYETQEYTQMLSLIKSQKKKKQKNLTLVFDTIKRRVMNEIA
jgi:hypothetical protein